MGKLWLVNTFKQSDREGGGVIMPSVEHSDEALIEINSNELQILFQ